MTDTKDTKTDTKTENKGKYEPVPGVSVESMEKVDENKSFKAIRQNKKSA